MSANQNLPILREKPEGQPDAEELPALAAGFVHEVKNPLASIHLHLQLLEGYIGEVAEDDLRTRMLSKVNFIKNEILGLNKTLHSFMQLIKPQHFERETKLDLNKLLEGVVELLEPQAAREGIILELQCGSLDMLYNLDSSFIKQISVNLVLNAIHALSEAADFTPEEAARRDSRIIIRTGTRNEFSYLMVADNGPGIPKKIRAKIFEPFFSTRQGKGSGLGLTLVKKMVGEMGGQIELQSEVGKGTTVIVMFQGQPRLAGNDGDLEGVLDNVQTG